jgi:hypothetical protein
MALNILDFRLAVIAELPETKNIYVERLMLDGIQELCRETYCFIENVTGMLSVKDTASYAVTVTTSNAELIGIHQAKYDTDTIEKISSRTMDHRDDRWESRTGTPDAFVYDGDINIRFNVTPDTSGKAISVEAIIQPNSVDGVVPPRIEKRHREAVKSYVKWKVYESPKTFNGDLAIYWKNDYTKRKNALKIEIARDGTDIEVRGRSFVTGSVRPPRSISLNE